MPSLQSFLARPFNTHLRRHIFFALLAVALTTGGLLFLRDYFGTPIMALLYLLPVGVSASFWGLGAGIVAAVASFLAFNFFFIEPYFTPLVHNTADVLVLVVFLIVAVVLSQLVSRLQAGLVASLTREQEATQLYELSLALAGAPALEELAQVLAKRTGEIFQAECVVVSVQAAQLFQAQYPASMARPPHPPTRLVPLQTARGLQGEIRAWRQTPLNNAEERLLQTFANQGALALERAHLAQAETQARVLVESDQLKSALLSSVSHELRTPLATIKASVTSLRSEAVPWEASARRELLTVIEEETDHLNRLVGNLLDMSRIEAGAVQLQRDWNAIAEIAGSVLNRLRPQLRHHHLELALPEDLPWVPADYVLVEQVLGNLISNSVKYAPRGTRIQLRAQRQGEAVQISVINEGPPVPPADLPHLFDKFRRFTATDRVTGTGLGLSICKGLVEAHGGRIWAENLAPGFAIHFTLPLNAPGLPPRPALPPPDL